MHFRFRITYLVFSLYEFQKGGLLIWQKLQKQRKRTSLNMGGVGEITENKHKMRLNGLQLNLYQTLYSALVSTMTFHIISAKEAKYNTPEDKQSPHTQCTLIVPAVLQGRRWLTVGYNEKQITKSGLYPFGKCYASIHLIRCYNFLKGSNFNCYKTKYSVGTFAI